MHVYLGPERLPQPLPRFGLQGIDEGDGVRFEFVAMQGGVDAVDDVVDSPDEAEADRADCGRPQQPRRSTIVTA